MAGKEETRVDHDLAPKFNGENPQQWISNIEAYFDLNGIPENQRIQVVELKLEGCASEWYQWMKSNDLFHDYRDLIEKIRVCFEPPDYREYIQGKISQANNAYRASSRIQRYREKFRSWSCFGSSTCMGVRDKSGERPERKSVGTENINFRSLRIEPNHEPDRPAGRTGDGPGRKRFE